jgi:hypothetical protein
MRSPFTVAQLPFHAMSTYPYPASENFRTMRTRSTIS